MPYPNISENKGLLDTPVYYSETNDGKDYIVAFITVESSRRTIAQIQTEIDTIDEGAVIDADKRAKLQAILDGNK